MPLPGGHVPHINNVKFGTNFSDVNQLLILYYCICGALIGLDCMSCTHAPLYINQSPRCCAPIRSGRNFTIITVYILYIFLCEVFAQPSNKITNSNPHIS